MYLSAAVVTDTGSDSGVGDPLKLPMAVTAYSVAGSSSETSHSGVSQMTRRFPDPFDGAAMTVNGPTTPVPGSTIASKEVGPVLVAIMAGAPAGGITNSDGAEAAVCFPLANVATAFTL